MQRMPVYMPAKSPREGQGGVKNGQRLTIAMRTACQETNQAEVCREEEP